MSKLSSLVNEYYDSYINKREEAMPEDVVECLTNIQVLFRKAYNSKETNVGKAEDPSSLKQLSEGDAIRPIGFIRYIYIHLQIRHFRFISVTTNIFTIKYMIVTNIVNE